MSTARATEWLDLVAAAIEVVVPGSPWVREVRSLTPRQRAEAARVLDGMLRERSVEAAARGART